MAGLHNDETLTRAPASSCDETRTGGVLPGSFASADRTLTKAIPGATLTHVGGTGTGELVDKVDWAIGDIIDGKYEVMGVLGKGANGVVHRVRHREW